MCAHQHVRWWCMVLQSLISAGIARLWNFSLFSLWRLLAYQARLACSLPLGQCQLLLLLLLLFMLISSASEQKTDFVSKYNKWMNVRRRPREYSTNCTYHLVHPSAREQRKSFIIDELDFQWVLLPFLSELNFHFLLTNEIIITGHLEEEIWYLNFSCSD